MKISLLALGIGFVLDLILGDPQWLWHPIRAIGKWISICEKLIRKLFPDTEKGLLAGGFLLVVLVTGMSTALPLAILWAAHMVSPWLRLVLESIMCYQLLATKSLKTESMKVYRELVKSDLKGARCAVSMIVGRDTENLTEEGVAKAAVETVAENASDGIIAPMIFMVVGGAVGGFFYKSVNTMDSMVGYKNDKYLYLGRCAALFDDVLNYIPARICAWLMIAASGIIGLDMKNAAKIYLRDRYNHASPNSAHTEAVMAGALRVQLAGDAWYFGKLHKKKFIGDPHRPVTPEDIRTANRLLYATAILSIIVFAGLKALLLFLL
ncbi:MAG: adenosylcobinamide-phosphate synthase CbiB [Lachnospiraceae bacterium]|nr:adenosylcobinamide-phosphate synthase CbiB [Lachnospiraceae bacterium]